MGDDGEQSRVETEEPPRTRSSDAVQSCGDQGLEAVSDGALVIGSN